MQIQYTFKHSYMPIIDLIISIQLTCATIHDTLATSHSHTTQNHIISTIDFGLYSEKHKYFSIRLDTKCLIL